MNTEQALAWLMLERFVIIKVSSVWLWVRDNGQHNKSVRWDGDELDICLVKWNVDLEFRQPGHYHNKDEIYPVGHFPEHAIGAVKLILERKL